MGTTARAPLKYSVRLDAKTSWKLQAKFVTQGDAEEFARFLAYRLRAAGELIIGVFEGNRLRCRVDIRGRRYLVINGKTDAVPVADAIGGPTVTRIPAEVDQGPTLKL